MSYSEMAIRMFLSTVLGGIIGIEREGANKAAGFRTHTLISAGSALIMLVSISMFEIFKTQTDSMDPARIAAQVVSGVGILCAGTIMTSGASVKGLTTAASMWMTAAIGLATGAGLYFLAVSSTLITLIVLVFFARVEKLIGIGGHIYELKLILKDEPGEIGMVTTALGKKNISIRNIEFEKEEDEQLTLSLFVKIPPSVTVDDMISALKEISGVYEVKLRK
ncbi:MgtC/SapB family protein [Calorimonas adulescens]|jgi:MgtC family.|uniref:MgtC/SapB family protein n=1 Tax=Calorimonas adulescens TaxID=2606906 RepID=A0A5D8QEJ3_9THEO|nr:MgtC/SapB family protein [Calorimonas adulescens]TZE82985.1 MgtC/SapB family protein [Calorimonas adulescens]